MPHKHFMVARAIEQVGVEGAVTVEEEKITVSAAGVLLLTEATMTEIPEPKPAAAAAEALP